MSAGTSASGVEGTSAEGLDLNIRVGNAPEIDSSNTEKIRVCLFCWDVIQ